MRPTMSLLACAALLAAGTATAGESAYSDRDLDACETIEETAEGPSVVLKCAGLAGLPVYFKESDLRQSQAYGPVGGTWLEEAFESFGPFNHTSARIEWRSDGKGRPFATILRWFVSDPETTGEAEERYGQVLVVSTVATAENPTSCVVGYVDALANREANVLARRVADEEAHDFACGFNEPRWHGERGALAGEPMRILPGEVE